MFTRAMSSDLMRLVSVAVVLSTHLACSSDDSTVIGAATPDAPDAPSTGAPIYMVQARISSPEGEMGYFIPTPTIEETADIQTENGIEEPGGGRLYAEEGIGMFMIGGGESPTITRYELGSDGNFTKGAVISFENYGVTFMPQDGVIFIDDKTAYLLDGSQMQFIEFDPTAMEIRDSLPIDGLEREGFDTLFGKVIKRDDGIYVPALWGETADYDDVPGGSALVRLVPATNEVFVTSDERCSGMGQGFKADNGDMYWFSTRENAIARRFYHQPNAVNDCGLRVRAGETTFDPDWEIDLTARMSGSAALMSLHASGTRIWLKALDETVAPVPDTGEWWTLTDLVGWQWYLLDVTNDAPAVRNDSRPVSTASAAGYTIDGRAFVTERSPDDSETTFLELLPSEFVPRMKVPGVVLGLARVR